MKDGHSKTDLQHTDLQSFELLMTGTMPRYMVVHCSLTAEVTQSNCLQ